ncbi:MAG TPA: lytic transglycosylase domain-containing protein [Thermotogota bacterium]|nr:lytic transglycosylase domain-containing protein [Thermotogota bacterium]
MDKKYIILCLLSLCVGYLYAYLFPNEVLYQQKPQIQLGYSEGSLDCSFSTRILTDTFFGYHVDSPMLAGLMQTESSFIVHSVSSSNALGPFQMKPFLAEEIGILNPFNPYNSEKVLNLLTRYKTTFGNMDMALGAYHIGFYGTKKISDSGSNPLSDNRIQNYVNKIHEFQRLYNEGDWIPLKDYLWFTLRYSLGNSNRISLSGVFPEFFLGSLAIGADYLSDEIISLDNLCLSIFQEFSFFWFMNLYVGYDDGLIAGCTLKSNDWFDRISVKYDFKQADLVWEAYNSFGLLFINYGFSKDNIFFSPGLEFGNKYCISFRVDYQDYCFKPGIGCTIKF